MRTSLRMAALLASILTANMAVFAQTNSPMPGQPDASGPRSADQAIQAFLVRQDSSDCTNSNVGATDPSLVAGTILLAREPDGNTSVKVATTAAPNTTYHFSLKCVKQLGDITTGDEGEATATFNFPTNSTGTAYAFEMSAEGAPAGTNYQSVQVRF